MQVFSLDHSLSLEMKFPIFYLAFIYLEATVLGTGEERGMEVYCSDFCLIFFCLSPPRINFSLFFGVVVGWLCSTGVCCT